MSLKRMKPDDPHYPTAITGEPYEEAYLRIEPGVEADEPGEVIGRVWHAGPAAWGWTLYDSWGRPAAGSEATSKEKAVAALEDANRLFMAGEIRVPPVTDEITIEENPNA